MGHIVTHYSFQDEMFSMLYFVWFVYFFIFVFGGRLQEQTADTKGWGEEWDSVA